MEKLPDHLGGGERRCHGDRGALQWAIMKWNIASMLDIGCGRGCVVKDAITFGVDAMGIDGDPGDLHEDKYKYKRDPSMPFLLHDYTVGVAPINREFDLAWSVEFLEHVESEYISNYMPSFQKCKYVIVTHAKPKPGTVNGRSATNHHHVNEQFEDYWFDIFHQYGFDHDSALTKELRAASTMTKNFIRDNGLVFIQR